MIYVSFALAAIFLSCKKGDTVSPANTNTTNNTTTVVSVTRSDLYPENGSISGTIVSKTSDNVYFSKQFNHQLDLEAATYYVNENGNYVIHLVKADKNGSVRDEDKQTDITFILKSDLTQALKLVELHSSVFVDSTATSITKFNVDQSVPTTGDMAVSNVTFDLTTGRLKADYTINVANTYTSSAKTASISGKIDTKLITIRYRMDN